MDARPRAAASGRRPAPWDASGARLDAAGMAPESWRRPGWTRRPTGIAGIQTLGAGVRALKNRS